MTETTFDQPEPEGRGGFDPERWEALGISRQDALGWWKHRITPNDAVRWRRAGVSEPINAVRWKIAGVTPDTVREWIYAQIDAREAVGWTELGFNVAEARKQKRLGRTAVQAYGHKHRMNPVGGQGGPPRPIAQRARASAQRARASGAFTHHAPPGMQRFFETVRQRNPAVMHSYVQRQWFDDEAIAWALHGIEAPDALAWKELGLSPVEAAHQQANGMDPMKTAKAWWQAGIPFDEAADWIGAGLTPQEAAEQRANGVSAERAAVLRSLRKQR